MNINPPIAPLQCSAKVGELQPGEADKVYLGMLGLLSGVLVVSVWHASHYWKPKR